MSDETLLGEGLEYDEGGSLQYKFAPGGNLECGPTGVEYTGLIRPPLAGDEVQCTPRPNCDCGPIYQNAAGNLWAPKEALFQCRRELQYVDNADEVITNNSEWSSAVISDSITNDRCHPMHYGYDICYSALTVHPGQRTSVEYSLYVNGAKEQLNECIDWGNSTVAGETGDVVTLSQCCLRQGTVLPGDSLSTTFQMRIKHTGGSGESIGVFENRIYVDRYVFIMEQCGDHPLGGNGQ